MLENGVGNSDDGYRVVKLWDRWWRDVLKIVILPSDTAWLVFLNARSY